MINGQFSCPHCISPGMGGYSYYESDGHGHWSFITQKIKQINGSVGQLYLFQVDVKYIIGMILVIVALILVVLRIRRQNHMITSLIQKERRMKQHVVYIFVAFFLSCYAILFMRCIYVSLFGMIFIMPFVIKKIEKNLYWEW